MTVLLRMSSHGARLAYLGKYSHGSIGFLLYLRLQHHRAASAVLPHTSMLTRSKTSSVFSLHTTEGKPWVLRCSLTPL